MRAICVTKGASEHEIGSAIMVPSSFRGEELEGIGGDVEFDDDFSVQLRFEEGGKDRCVLM